MLRFNKTKEIPFNKLMLTKDAALSARWNNTKQTQWGILTSFAIECTSDKLKKGEFKNISEAFFYLANFRQLIGAILGHHNDAGKRRKLGASTPLTNDEESQYKDMHSEVHSLVENLKLNREYVPDSLVTLKGIDIYNISFERSKISTLKNGYKVWHSASGQQSFELADAHFANLLNNPDLSVHDKEFNTEGVLFHISDCMPCIRGSAAIAQMLFYALEDAFIGNIRYIGQLNSQFGNKQGVSPDIAAMLSPSLSDFQYYLKRCNYDPELKVVKSDKPVLSTVSSEELLHSLADMQVEVQRFDEMLKKHCNYANARFGQKCWSENLSFLITLAKENHDQPALLNQIDIIKSDLVKAMGDHDPYLYLDFCKNVKDKTQWPPPIMFEPPSENMVHLFNENLGSLLSIYNKFTNTGISLSPIGQSRDFFNVATPATAKMSIVESDSLILSFAELDDAVRKYPGLSKGLDFLIDIVIEMDKLKNTSMPKEEIVNQLFKDFYEKVIGLATDEERKNHTFERYIQGTQPWGVNAQKRFLNEMFDNLDAVKNGLYGCSVFQPILKLNQANLQLLIEPNCKPKTKL